MMKWSEVRVFENSHTNFLTVNLYIIYIAPYRKLTITFYAFNCNVFRCWAANIQVRPNMSEVVEHIREIQRYFPEASDPLVFCDGKLDVWYYKTSTFPIILFNFYCFTSKIF